GVARGGGGGGEDHPRRRRKAEGHRAAGREVTPQWIPGTIRLVRRIYSRYSSPNRSSIIRSSRPTRQKNSVPNPTRPENPAIQLGSSRACAAAQSQNAAYIGWRSRA